MKHLQLFPTNVGIVDVDNSESLIKDILAIPEIDSGKYKFIHRNNIWDMCSEYNALQTLHDIILKSVAEYAHNCYGHEYMPEHFKCDEGWVETVKPNRPADQMMHNHRLTHVAAVFYMSAADNCGNLDLVDPRGTLGHISLDSRRPYNVFRFKPESGKLLLFPGWVLHYIHPNMSETTRKIIATNVQLRDDAKLNEPTHQITPNVSSMKLRE